MSGYHATSGDRWYDLWVPRTTVSTAQLHATLIDAGIALSVGQLQRATEARLGPPDSAADPIGHWRTLAGLAAGQSRRLPDANESALDLALAGFSTLRLRDAVRQLAIGDETAEAVAKVRVTAADGTLDVVAGRMVEQRSDAASELGPLADRLVRGARASGSDLAEGVATSAVEDILRLAVLGNVLGPLGTAWTLDDTAGDIAMGLSGAIDRKAISYGLALVSAAVGSDGPAAFAGIIEEASLDNLAEAVRVAFPLLDLAAALGTWSGNVAERRIAAAQLVPTCLLLARALRPYALPGTSGLDAIAVLVDGPAATAAGKRYRSADPAKAAEVAQ
jgi:hypothetical protein